MKIISTKTYKDFGRPDARDVPDPYFLIQPPLISGCVEMAEALSKLERALGFNAQIRSRVVKSPIEDIIIKAELLPHIVEKREHRREKYGNYIIPTLMNPFEIYLTKYESGFRHQYIGLFKGNKSILTVANVNPDGCFLWNVMQCDIKSVNSHRKGEELVYIKEKCSSAEAEEHIQNVANL